MKIDVYFHFNEPLKVEAAASTELAQINKKLDSIMSAVSEFAAKMAVHNDKVDAAVEGLKSDLAELEAKIEELQNSPGEITPEDQALLDSIESRSAAISEKITALDAIRPPVPPTE